MYVGFILTRVTKREEPEIGEGSSLLFRAPAVCVFHRLIPRGSLPSVARSA